MKEPTSIRHEVRILPQLNKACGLDIHKDKICCFISDNTGEKQFYQEFGTFTKELHQLKEWLIEHEIRDCIMESTGVYWMSLYSILSASNMNVIVANPQFIKQIPKRKTDKKDAKWLCTLLLNGLSKGSFIAPKTQRELRDLCRSRLHYTQHRSKTLNRIVKVLEINNIKIRSVASSVNTKSCMEMIRHLAKGERDITKLKECCKGRLRKKIDQMGDALQGTLTDNDSWQLQCLLKDIDHIDGQLNSLENRISQFIEQDYRHVVECLDSITGVGLGSAQVIVSEIGKDMSSFASSDHLTSWCGLSPGNNESAGKRRNTSVKKGNKYLRIALIAVAWGAVKTKNSYWRGLFEKLRKRMKSQKAIVAIARRILKVVYKTIKEEKLYSEKGIEHFISMQTRKKENQLA
ncbi:MAG: IS110 family transposase [Bacteroidetes bacterium]|nr:IS110 family transposase [Bacteroidota bacterium]